MRPAVIFLLFLSLAANASETVLTTETPDHIWIEAHHIIIVKEENQYFVKEYLKVVNSGDSAFIGIETDDEVIRHSLRFHLPEGYSNLSFQGGLAEGSVEAHENVLYDTLGMEPGTKEITFYYSFPVADSFVPEINYPTKMLGIFLNNKETESRRDIELYSLVRQDDKPLPDGFYYVFTGQELNPGVKAGFRLNDPVTAVSGSGNHKITTAAILAAALAAIIFFLFRKPCRNSEAGSLEAIKDKLVFEIATLDEMNETQELDPEEYRTFRESKMKQLVEVSRKLENN